MKYNIKQSKKDSLWWSWSQKCDRCGADCHHDGVLTSQKPDTEEADFCLKCYRELMDQGIPYKEAYKMYKRQAGMMELVDKTDSKSVGLCRGSPSLPTSTMSFL